MFHTVEPLYVRTLCTAGIYKLKNKREKKGEKKKMMPVFRQIGGIVAVLFR